jgi:hypothetical protein
VTQNVGRQVGGHYANTYISAPVCHKLRLNQNPMDVMVYHAPHEDRRLTVTDAALQDQRRLHLPYTVRYVWEGIVEANRKYAFAHLLLPIVPRRKEVWSNDPSAATLEDVLGKYPAEGVDVLVDDEARSVWRICAADGREEWIVFNADGEPVDVKGLATDARQAYVDIHEGTVARVTAMGVTTLKVADAAVIKQAKRGDYEK